MSQNPKKDLHITPFGKESNYKFLNLFGENNKKPNNKKLNNTSPFKPNKQTDPPSKDFFQIKPT